MKVTRFTAVTQSLPTITWRCYGPPAGRVGPLRPRTSAALPARKLRGQAARIVALMSVHVAYGLALA